MKTLELLFGGTAAEVQYIDETPVQVYVRAMPQRFLGRVLSCAEFKTALVELCTYVKHDGSLIDEVTKRAAYPDIPPPVGYAPVPEGWTDNLDDASVDFLYEKAKQLNFHRAVDWARGEIAAKKLVAPLHEMALTQVLPLVDKIMAPLMKKLEALSPSTPSAPSSSAKPASSS